MDLTITRPPLRLLLYALLAVPAILLAVDMTFSYRFIPEPESTEVVVGQTIDASGQTVDVTEAVLTDTGKAQRRRDVVFGIALFAGGAASLGWALWQLTSPVHLLAADDGGLHVPVDGFRHPLRLISWDSIAEIRSGVVEDDGVECSVLSIRLRDPVEVPIEPASAIADPPWLHLFDEEWEIPAPHVAALLETRLEPHPE